MLRASQLPLLFPALVAALASGACSEASRSDTPPPVANDQAVPERLPLELRADINRDGIIDSGDDGTLIRWSWDLGAFVFVNLNDSDNDGRADAEDAVVNGPDDAMELTPVVVQADPRISAPGTARLTLSMPDARAQSRVRMFRRKDGRMEVLPPSAEIPVPVRGEILLFLEARTFASDEWDGMSTIEGTLKDANRRIVGTASLTLRASPFLLTPNTSRARALHVRERGQSNAEFIAQIRGALLPLGVDVNVAPPSPLWQDMWMQNTMKFGYTQIPTRRGPLAKDFVLSAARGEGLDTFAATLLSPDMGHVKVGKPRALRAADGWSDWYGNLDVTPPLPGAPHGLFYYGNSGTAALHPKVVAMLKAQELQGTGVEIDTSWLFIRHVDEIITFVEGAGGALFMLVTSPGEGVRLLRDAGARAPASAVINRGLRSQTTLGAAMANTALLDHNLALQRDKVDAIVARLMRAFRLQPRQVIHVPALYARDGSGWMPNLVNAQLINGHLLIADPRFPDVGGTDFMQAHLERILSPLGVRLHFLNDTYYHDRKGNVYCGTIALRDAPAAPLWSSRPSPASWVEDDGGNIIR